MSGPRNNLDEILRRNNRSVELPITRGEGSKPKSEQYKFKRLPDEDPNAPNVSRIPNPQSSSSSTSLHTQFARSEFPPSEPPSVSRISSSIRRTVPMKRSSPESTSYSANKRVKKDLPLSDHTELDLQTDSNRHATVSLVEDAAQPPPQRIAPPTKVRPKTPPRPISSAFGADLSEMSTRKLNKLQLGRQKATINAATNIFNKLRGNDDSEELDLDAMMRQFEALKNSANEVEEILKRRQLEETTVDSSPNRSLASILSSPIGTAANLPDLRPGAPETSSRVVMQTTEVRRMEVAELDGPSSSNPPARGASTFRTTSSVTREAIRQEYEIGDEEEDGALWEGMGDIGGPSHDAFSVPPVERNHRDNVSRIKAAYLPEDQSADEPAVDYTGHRSYQEVIQVRNNIFQLRSFRKHQLEAIMSALSGKDVFVLMPTGGGKSLCYQLPAVCTTGTTRGVTIVVSPLIALMDDQLKELQDLGIDATNLHSEQDVEMIKDTNKRLRSLSEDKPALVYISPEKLTSSLALKDMLNQLYSRNQLARFVIDECHVLPGWGRGFRDSYMELYKLRKDFPKVPIMALTATATKQGIQDVIQKLQLRPDHVLLQQSFNRPNLIYRVAQKKKAVNTEIAEWIKRKYPEARGIIYCLSKFDCEKVSEELNQKHGLVSTFYHAEVDKGRKRNILQDWKAGRVLIIVATIAFGMGINQADVRFVIHHSLPKNLEGYYQETGRAGRDGKVSECILYYSWNDVQRYTRMLRGDDAMPVEEQDRQISQVRSVYQYCVTDVGCRRVDVLRHFGQEFLPEHCQNTCDNCISGNAGSLKDLTFDALNLVQLVRERKDPKLTQNLCAVAFLGSNNSTIRDRGYRNSPFFGKGQHLGPTVVHRLITHLIMDNVLTETISEGRGEMGWSHTYLKLGTQAEALMQGSLKVEMRVSDSMAGLGGNKKDYKGKRVNGTVRSINRTVVEEITCYDDGDDLGQPIEHYSRIERGIEEDYILPNDPKPSGSRSLSRQTAHVQTEVICLDDDDVEEYPGNSDPSTKTLHDSLLQLRKELAQQKRKQEADILSDECVQMLACMPPTDPREFRATLMEVYGDEGKVKIIMDRGALRFLDACIQQARKTTTAPKPQPKPKASESVREIRSKFTFDSTTITARRGKQAETSARTVRPGIRQMDV